MREILFKGKRTDNGEWVYGNLSQHKTGKKFIKCGSAIHSYEVIPETVGQFTGVYSANTNKIFSKIFEHDIVIKVVDGKELVGVVEYSEGAFGVRFTDGSGQLLCFFEGCCKIIGNAYDNPELLEVGVENA